MLLSFSFDDFAYLQRNLCKVDVLLHSGAAILFLNVVDGTADVGEHLSFECLRLILHNFIEEGNLVVLLLLQPLSIIFEVLNVLLKNIVEGNFLAEILKLLFILLFRQHFVKSLNYKRHSFKIVALVLYFVLTCSYRRQTLLVKVL